MSGYLEAETLFVQWATTPTAQSLILAALAHPAMQNPPQSIHVSTEVPGDRPGWLITAERTGGGADRFQDFPALAIQCWAPSRWEAERLGSAVRNAMNDDLRYHPHVSRLSIGGLYNFPDPDSRHARFQLVADLATSAY